MNWSKRQVAVLAARSWADDWAEWLAAGVETWRQSLQGSVRPVLRAAHQTATLARAHAFAWAAPRRRALTIAGVAVLLQLLLATLFYVEVRTSWIEAHLFARYARGLSFHVQPGPAAQIRFPRSGPYDERLGYTRIPEMVDRLRSGAFEVTRQAEYAPPFSALSRFVFPPYHEKTVAGLTLLDGSRRTLYGARYPRRAYATYDSIPDVLVRSLLFLENRELLEENGSYRNPAVEWDRLAAAVTNLTLGRLFGSEHTFGGSTLATQMEKFRHSPGGLTQDPRDKIQQLASASLRSYLDGPATYAARRRIITDYVNSVPLGASNGYGEVIGMADGLWAWFGLDFDSANHLLSRADVYQLVGENEARAYRSAVALLVAQRRPAFYLAGSVGRASLERQTDVQLRLLAREGIISPTLGRAALAVNSGLRDQAPETPPASFAEHKAANAIRATLLPLLGAPSLYALDRYDLSVRSTVDRTAQQAVADKLSRLRNPAYAHALGFDKPRMLGANDPAAVTYSMVLYERTPLGNMVRVQADNLDTPFDLNQGARLELGSTAKLRTLVSYLEVVEQLHRLTRAGVAPSPADDPLTHWAAEFHRRHPRHGLGDMLDAALQRTYSASPRERFFTGGGMHRFRNFDSRFDDSLMTVEDAFANSVNLVFIRLMGDLVRYYENRLPGVTPAMFANADDPARRAYLEQFVERDSRAWLGRFFNRYRGVPPGGLFDSLLSAHRLTPLNQARAFLVVVPDGNAEQFAATASGAALLETQGAEFVGGLFHRAERSSLSLNDAGALTRIHPLELWMAAYLRLHPAASWGEVAEASASTRLESYRWLFESERGQGRALDIALEAGAFERIHSSWRRLGYPYDDLVPSLATAIGSSGDNPEALSKLVGILLDDGVRRPMVLVDELRFAEGTPYETVMRRTPEAADPVVSPEVAAAARGALLSVVNRGTASALRGVLRTPDDREIVIGGKTGTGENEYKIFGNRLGVIESRSVSRTATFVFFIGEQFFGTITAFVEGPASEAYQFTSALPVRLFSILLDDMKPLFQTAPEWSPLPRWATAAPVALWRPN